mmetsp:Transcript_31252/g.58694  ORF Transcript_31252/g.58694 Transcript_31252/m.58694 type:complete len:562 (-) Transcript_31252:222-1907(-)
MSLHSAVQAVIRGHGSLSEVDQALDQGKDPPQGLDSPLRWAVNACHLQLVHRLLRGRADVNGQDSQGVAPLHLAVFNGRSRVVSELLHAAADANVRDCHGQSPIFFAPSRQICEILMARGADVSVVNAQKQTPLHLLARAGLHDVVACVLDVLQASALDLKDSSGATPLLYAAGSKVKSIVSLLHAKKQNMPETPPALPPVSTQDEDLQRQQGEAQQDEEEPPTPTPRTTCPAGHPLEPFETPEDGFLCSICECEFMSNTTLYGCRPCDYDLCRDCLSTVAVHSTGYKDFVAVFPELEAFRGTVKSGESVLTAEVAGAQLDEPTSETDSFASQQDFADEAQAGIEEEDGCLYWQVLLKKESTQDKFGMAQANGKVEFEIRLEAKAWESGRHPRLPGPEMLIVKRIYPDGLLQKWNARVPQLEIRRQDRIVAVNDKTTVEAMAAEMQERRVFLQLVRFPDRFVVGLSKESGIKLGFRFERPQGTFAEEVRITEVLDDGALMAYNRHQVELERYAFVVLPEMRIDRVNDVWGDAELIANELKFASVVDLHIRRADDFLSTPTP